MRDFLPDWTVPKSSAQEANVSSSLTPMPQIKPLVWHYDDGLEQFETSTWVGDFTVYVDVIGKWVAEGIRVFETEAEAKAACQTEYERRVRECLE